MAGHLVQHVHAVLQFFIEVAGQFAQLAELVFFNPLHDVRAHHMKLQDKLGQQQCDGQGHRTQGQL